MSYEELEPDEAPEVQQSSDLLGSFMPTIPPAMRASRSATPDMATPTQDTPPASLADVDLPAPSTLPSAPPAPQDSADSDSDPDSTPESAPPAFLPAPATPAPLGSAQSSVPSTPGIESLTNEERASRLSDILLSAVVRPGEVASARRRFLFSRLHPEVLRDENYMLYRLMVNFKDSQSSFAVDREFIDTYYGRVHMADIERERNKIDITAYGEIDGSASKAYAQGIVKKYEQLLTMPEVDEETFERSFHNYNLYYRQIEMARVLSQGQMILEDGLKPASARSPMSGFEDAMTYIRLQMTNIASLTDTNRGLGILTPQELEESFKDDYKSKRVSDFGDLEILNNHYNGIQTGRFYGFLAPPKSGKTKLTIASDYKARTKYGVNTVAFPAEGGARNWIAQTLAMHFHKLFNEGRPHNERIKGIDGVKIQSLSDYGLEAYEHLVQQAREDLYNNADYGQTNIITEPLHLDTAIDLIDTAVSANNAEVISVDYPGVIQYPEGMKKHEAVAKFCVQLADYTKQKGVAVISPFQFKQEYVSALARGDDADIRVGVADSAEAMRSVDVMLAMYASAQETAENRLNFLEVQSRIATPFERFTAYADLSVCDFRNINR